MCIRDRAKAANMPNDNIKRVLEKAAGAGSGDNYETITNEGYGPGGVAVIVETMTDNRNRTAGSMRHHFDKYGGNMGASGCVSWSFDRKGVLVIDNEDGDYEEDAVMMDAMDSGADDFEAEEDCFTVYTAPDDFNTVADALTAKGYAFASAQIEICLLYTSPGCGRVDTGWCFSASPPRMSCGSICRRPAGPSPGRSRCGTESSSTPSWRQSQAARVSPRGSTLPAPPSCPAAVPWWGNTWPSAARRWKRWCWAWRGWGDPNMNTTARL